MKQTMDQHPTVKLYRHKNQHEVGTQPVQEKLDASMLRRIVMEAGADDVGFVSMHRHELDDQRKEILSLFPEAKSCISYVCKMAQEPLRSTARSIANNEFHHVNDKITEVGHRIVAALEKRQVKAIYEPAGFPMEVERNEKKWVISHKPISVAAGLGKIGLHRNVIHPTFGNFILLGTVVLNKAISEEGQLLDYNPCLDCKLCVAACPVGAIEPDGKFNFSACFTHNYREFFGGFTEWAESMASSKDAKTYRNSFSSGESASMWQSLSFGANYKAAYCLSVCPAGEDVIGQYIDRKKEFVNSVLKPLQNKEETLYITKNSDARAYAQKRYPHKKVKIVHSGLRASSVASFYLYLPHTFQRKKAKTMDATYHFIFYGKEEMQFTVNISKGEITTEKKLVGEADLTVIADSETWIDVLNGDKKLLWALLARKLKINGPISLMKSFRRCFAT
ncbi:SCP2 sterol-binding domain-containing protein [Longirhabdus pacifica]|uniref:SCP2 sterol-binding domain-containing protein n=1 Tax=Longirhabdus pacifica TaxID=2305227 RepID=UPI001008D227|nr:SCP2 sterol-binding domain-containing protein [Longirhabdus pacifica]